jgi:hypothetical protein
VWLVDAHILDGNSFLSRLDLKDSIDHPKRKSMWKFLQDFTRVSHSHPNAKNRFE